MIKFDAKKFKEKLSGRIFFALALFALSALLLITVFIIIESVPFITKYGFFKFLFGTKWEPVPIPGQEPGTEKFGIFPMIIGSLSVTFGAILIGVPIGVCCSVFLSEFAPVRFRNVFRPAIQLLAGIPSVVYGFVGMIFVVPFIQNFLGGPGLSILAGSVILAIMILPTVISISEVALLSLPKTYKEGALALGMTHWQSIWRVQIPAAKSGIIASVILGIGRAVGETMAVIMVLGNATALPSSILDPVRTLTTNIGMEMSYAEGAHQGALFATGLVLFALIMVINSLAQYITRDKLKGEKKRAKSRERGAEVNELGIEDEVGAGACARPPSVRAEQSEAPQGDGAAERQMSTADCQLSTPDRPPAAGRRPPLISPRFWQIFAKVVIWAAAVLVLTVLAAIIIYLLIKGLPVLNWKFLTQNPKGDGSEGGIASIIGSTFLITAVALLIALPFGIGAAFYLAEYTKENIITRIIRFSVESLAGIPSIVYGLFGFIVFVTAFGLSVISGGLTLAIMILPTIIRTSEEAIKTVPAAYRETSFSLGATKWQTIRKAVFPSALRGIVNGVILSVGRCVAETAAVIFTAGSALRMRTMASHFYILALEGISPENAYGTAALLIILIFIVNIGANALVNRFVAKEGKRAQAKGKR